MSRKRSKNDSEETPHDMMKRVFAVAELIVRSDGYRPKDERSKERAKKHKPEDLLYCIDQPGNSGLLDGTEET